MQTNNEMNMQRMGEYVFGCDSVPLTAESDSVSSRRRRRRRSRSRRYR